MASPSFPLAAASPHRSPISRARARHRSCCSRASAKRPRQRETTPEPPHGGGLAGSVADPARQGAAPFIVLPRLGVAAESEQDGGPNLPWHRPPPHGRLQHARGPAPRPAAPSPRRIERATGDGDRARRAPGRADAASPSRVGERAAPRRARRARASRRPRRSRQSAMRRSIFARSRARDEPRHGERAVGEADRGVVEVALLEVRQRGGRGSAAPASPCAPFRKCSARSTHSAPSRSFGLLRRGAAPRLRAPRRSPRGTPRGAAP